MSRESASDSSSPSRVPPAHLAVLPGPYVHPHEPPGERLALHVRAVGVEPREVAVAARAAGSRGTQPPY